MLFILSDSLSVILYSSDRSISKFFSLTSQFCEVITLNSLKHLSGRLVWIMMDYVDHVTFCSKLKAVLLEHKEWAEICQIQGA